MILESPISIPNYTVTISDHDKLKYENGKFEALALTGDTPVQVTFTMLDKLIPGSCTYNITIQRKSCSYSCNGNKSCQ